MSKNKIFIFEFVSGGGFNQGDIPSSLFCEGYGMLKSIITDFKALNLEISTLLDYRISFLSTYLKADYIEQVNVKENYIKKFKKAVKKCDSCFIIAPEFSNILYDLTKIAKDNYKKILSIELEGIKLGSSKFKTYQFFKASGVNTPQTFIIPFKNNTLDVDFIIQKFNKLNYPIVIKPDDGVGADSIFYFDDELQIYNFFNLSNNMIEPERSFILQEYIEGEDLSISLIGTSNFVNQLSTNPVILTVNSQNINIKKANFKSEYFGGCTPVKNLEKQITAILQKLNLKQFKGYFGIDFIRKADNSIYFIEINSRLTTSYIGLRNIVNYNPVELILNPSSKFLDSKENVSLMHSIFSRIELSYEGNKSSKQIKEEIIPTLIEEIPELVTPPISFTNSNQNKNTKYSCFVATKEKDHDSSRKRIIEIMKLFEKYNFFEFKLV